MRILNYFTSFQEVPDKLSLCFSVYGCPHNCKNCSWKDEKNFLNLTVTDILEIVDKNKEFIDCVCFLGGEWEPEFKTILSSCREMGLLTCLYTGLEDITDNDILSNLNYVKVGPYIENLGGLQSKTTNQKFIDLKTYECLNYKFLKL